MGAPQGRDQVIDPRAEREDVRAAISAVDVSKQFGDQVAVRDVSFDVSPGIILGYVISLVARTDGEAVQYAMMMLSPGRYCSTNRRSAAPDARISVASASWPLRPIKA